MKKLENIPKKNIYQVPDGYFDELPGIIQSRITYQKPEQEITFSWLTTIKYALPVMIIGVIGLIWYTQSVDTPKDVNSILATIETDALVAYINASDISTDELLDSFSFDQEDISSIENEVYGNLYDEELDVLADEFDMDLDNL